MFNDSSLQSLALWQLLAVAVSFMWSGFVRSGLGFGGAALTLPVLLMIHNDVLLYLPAICWQLLFFSLLTVMTRLEYVNWRYLRRLTLLLALPFAAGLLGLLNLPDRTLALSVYSMTLIYGALYVSGRVVVSRGRFMDTLCILLGGYVSGVSLIGAPLIVAYSTRRLPAVQLRDTLFVMWIVLVTGKLTTFAVAGVDLQWQLALLTLPMVALGHFLGLKVHRKIAAGEQQYFHRIIGAGLCAVSLLGISSAF